MIERYIEEHLPKKRPASQAEDLGLIKQWIDSLRHLRVAAVTIEDVDNLHRKITRAGTPYRANRVLALLSKMFALASKRWRWRADNPCRGVERNQEMKRTRYLTAAELERLTAVLAAYPDQQAANIVRLLLFTGRGEARRSRPSGRISISSSGCGQNRAHTTKQKTAHRIPFSAPARALLASLPRSSDYVFPGPRGAPRRVDLKGAWPKICEAAGIKGVRVHDLRHTYAIGAGELGAKPPDHRRAARAFAAGHDGPLRSPD